LVKATKNESALINCKKEGLSEICRVNGTLSAKIRYDLEGAFGLRRHSFYLPAMSDSEFSSRYGQYAFFDRKGFLRAENVDNTGASIVIYSGRNENLFGQSKPGVNDKQKVAQINLDVGEVKLNSSKTGETRNIPLNESVSHLQRYKKECFVLAKNDDYVFLFSK